VTYDDEQGYWLDIPEYPEKEHDEDIYWEWVYIEREDEDE
jgi:hypothetical protein